MLRRTHDGRGGELMEETRQSEEGGPPAVVGIAAIVGFGKAVFEGLFGIIAVAAADSISDGFGLGATLFAIAYAVSSLFLWRGNRAALYATVALSVFGLVVAVVYWFQATDAALGAAIALGGLNALVLYLLLGTSSGREYFAKSRA
jgi:hypothetical protein